MVANTTTFSMLTMGFVWAYHQTMFSEIICKNSFFGYVSSKLHVHKEFSQFEMFLFGLPVAFSYLSGYQFGNFHYQSG